MSGKPRSWPANDNRPPEFDARLMSYMPALRRLAVKIDDKTPDDTINDFTVFICERWTNFRGDIKAPKNGFYSWLQINLRSMVQARRKRKVLRETVFDDAYSVAQPSSQEVQTLLSQVVKRLGKTREGRMLLSLSQGNTLEEVGLEFSVSRERVRQITEPLRADLKQVA